MEVAAVCGINLAGGAGSGVGKEPKIGAGEPFEPEGGGGKGPLGEEQGEGVDDEFRLALAQIGKPNEAIGEGLDRICRASGGADHGDAFLALPEKSAGVIGGE